MKAYAFLILLVMLAPFVVADDWGYVGENYVLWADIIEQPNFFNAAAANVTVYDSDGNTVITNAGMANVDVGRFSYNFTPELSGVWYAYVDFYNGSQKIGIASQSFFIDERVITMDMFTLLVIFCIGIALIFLAQFMRSNLMFAFAGVWFLAAMAMQIQMLSGMQHFTTLFSALLALALILHAIFGDAD